MAIYYFLPLTLGLRLDRHPKIQDFDLHPLARDHLASSVDRRAVLHIIALSVKIIFL